MVVFGPAERRVRIYPGLESQQESVCRSCLGQTSTNQHKQTAVCLAGQQKVRRSSGTQSCFFFSLSLSPSLIFT